MSPVDEREIRLEDYGQHVRVGAFYPDWNPVLDRDDLPVHQPEASEAPIPDRHWYSGCDPDRPRVRPDGTCEGCGATACPECGREDCPDHPRVDRPLTAGEAEGAIVHPATRGEAA